MIEFALAYIIDIMMLGSKGLLTPMIHGLIRISCSSNPKNTSNPLIFLRKMAAFWCFGGSTGQKSSCKQACIGFCVYLTLVSFIISYSIGNTYENFVYSQALAFRNERISCRHSSRVPALENLRVIPAFSRFSSEKSPLSARKRRHISS